MLTYLRDNNPAQEWLRERFQIHQALANGQHILLRFDIQSFAEQLPPFWTTEKVLEHFEHAILADKETDYGEHLSVATTIADVLNQKCRLVRDEICWQSRISFSILDALYAHNMSAAHLLTGRLGMSLLNYEPRASEVWSCWVDMVFHIINADNDTEFGLDTVI